jgi:hypothetical protein
MIRLKIWSKRDMANPHTHRKHCNVSKHTNFLLEILKFRVHMEHLYIENEILKIMLRKQSIKRLSGFNWLRRG